MKRDKGANEQLGEELKRLRQRVAELEQAQQSLQRSEEKYRHLFENLNDAAFLADPDTGLILETNQQGAILLGRSHDEIVGMRQSEVHPPGETDRYRAKFRTHVEKGHAADYDGVVIRNDGTTVPVAISASVFTIGGRRLILGLFRDISELKRAEEELSKYRNHLEEQVEERTVELKTTVEKLGREITERKRVEEVLGELEEKYRTLAENSPNGIFISDAERFIYVNQRLCEITGFSRDEVLNMPDPVGWVFAPEERERVLSYARIRLSGGPAPSCYEARGIRKGGDEISLKLTVSSIVLSGRNLLQGTVEDITERKRAEEDLRVSEEKYRTLAQATLDGIVTMGENGRILFWNRGAETIFGYTVEEAVGKELAQLVVPPQYREAMSGGLKGFFETRTRPFTSRLWEFPGLRKNGAEFAAELSVASLRVRDEWEAVAVVRDITERKRAEDNLRQSEERYRTLFENSIEAVFTVDIDGNFTSGNKALEELTGYTMDELIGASYKRVVAPENVDFVFKEFNKLFRTGEPISNLPYEFVTRNGERRLFEGYANVIKDKDRIVGFQGTLRDITERKRAEEALRESEEFSSSLLDNAPNPILVINPDTSVSYVNPALEELTGFSLGELIGGKAPYPWWTEETVQETGKDLEEAMLKGARKLEELFQKKNGERFWVEITSTPVVRDGEFKYYLSNWVDITERNRAQEKLKASLKEKEVLLNEIHHRVKNNLQVISSLLRLQSGYIEDERYAAMFKESQSRVQSMALIHDKLYQSEDLARIDVGEYIKSLAGTVFRSYGSDAGRIALKTEVEGIMLGANYAMSCGLIVNELASNSLKHAFPKGQKGEIRIAMRPIGENDFELVVSDNGIGIREDLDFKNTESLGLQLVTILAEDQLGGQIELDRTEGTRFQIRFGVAQ